MSGQLNALRTWLEFSLHLIFSEMHAWNSQNNFLTIVYTMINSFIIHKFNRLFSCQQVSTSRQSFCSETEPSVKIKICLTDRTVSSKLCATSPVIQIVAILLINVGSFIEILLYALIIISEQMTNWKIRWYNLSHAPKNTKINEVISYLPAFFHRNNQTCTRSPSFSKTTWRPPRSWSRKPWRFINQPSRILKKHSAPNTVEPCACGAASLGRHQSSRFRACARFRRTHRSRAQVRVVKKKHFFRIRCGCPGIDPAVWV